MKIAIITNSHIPLDTRVYHKIALTLSERHDVRIFNTFPEPETIMRNPSFEQIKETRKCIQLRVFYYRVKDYRPDVVICVEPLTLIVGIKLKRVLKCKLVYDCHEFFALAFSERFKNPILSKLAYGLYYNLENFLLRFTDSSIAVNEYLGARLAEAGENVHICANNPVAGIKEKSQDAIAKKYDFIYAGGISYNRGLRIILQACRLLKTEITDFKFLFIGKFINEETKCYFNDYIEQHSLKKNVLYYGVIPHERVFHYLEQSKFGVMLTNPDVRRYRLTLSLKVLEYLETGLPVIVNNYPIMKRRIINQGTGIGSDYTAEDLKDTFIKCLEISEKNVEYNKFRENAVELYRRKYTWESQVAELEKAVEPIMIKRVLLFAYFFPPLGGPGVQRPCKMIKYLRKSNIVTDVISVRNIQFHSNDDSLLNECRAENVIRTLTADPMGILYFLKKYNKQKSDDVYFNTSEKKKKFIRAIFPVDEKILWLPFALSAAFKLLKQNKYDSIMATIGPYTSGLAAYIVSMITGKELVVDYRDHWTINRYIFYATGMHRILSEKLERMILRKAKTVSVVSETMKDELVEKFGTYLKKKIIVMYNGWDEEDFLHIPESEDKRLVFSYVGNFYGKRSPEYLIKALKEMKTENQLPDNIVFRFIGNYHVDWMDMLGCPELKGVIETFPQVNHDKAVEMMCSSDVLLLFIATASGKNVLTGKIFEYLRSGREILAMVPSDGDAERTLMAEGYKFICPMEDVSAIKKCLRNLLENGKKNLRTKAANPYYSRENQVLRLAERIRDDE